MKAYEVDIKGPIWMERVATLPGWTAADEGREVYVEDDNKRYHANDSEWVEYTLGGTSGSSGSSGSSGTSGSSGSSGSSGTSGDDGTSGSSGSSGSSGTSGEAGTSGDTGTSGSSGTSGIGGATATTATTVSASTYDVLATDDILHVTYTSTGTVAIDLKTAQLENGRIIRIKDAGGNAEEYNITITTEGAETIDGVATAVIYGNYGALSIYSDGTNWFIY